MVTHIRLPDPKEIDSIIDGAGKRSEMAERKLKTAVGNALLSMDAGDKATMLRELGLTETMVQNLLQRPRLDAQAVTTFKTLIGAMQQRDASGLTSYPSDSEESRALASDEKSAVGELMDDVAKVMREVHAGKHDTYVANVFGASHVDDAKKVFLGAADALDRLRPGRIFSGGIVVDQLRKNDVWCCGGLTNSECMALPPHVVRAAASKPGRDSDVFLTMVHESTHALRNGATTDVLYEHHDGFLRAGAQAKLKTADYYKEVVRQVATSTGRVFVESDVSLNLDEPRTIRLQTAATQADKVLNAAWVTAIRIHGHVHAMARDPGKYVGWETWLRNASRLMGVTLHREADLKFERNLLSRNTGPRITSADLSVIDNKIAILAQCNGKAKGILVEPAPELDAGRCVDHVVRQVLLTHRAGLRFSKSDDKDVVVLHSLAVLHESVSPTGRGELFTPAGGPALDELPEPMKSYDLARRQQVV